MTAPAPATTRHDKVPYRGWTTLLALGVPAAIIATTTGLAVSWRHDLPDPIAVHWGLNGPDGFSSLTTSIVWSVVAGSVVASLLWALGFFAGRQSFTRRGAAALAVWFTILLSGVSIGGLSVQRGVADARDAGSIDGVLLVTFLVATAAAGIVTRLIPGDPPLPTSEPVSPTAARLKLGRGEDASWVRYVTSPGYFLAIGGVVLTVALVGLLGGQWWFALVLGVTIGLSLVAFLHWTVIVDRDGLTVRSILRRPCFRIPLNEVEMAEVVEVRPLREFGGWGIRSGMTGGRMGVVVRKGPALQVHRTGGRVFLVTVDDAATGAALLNTLAGRTRG
jgi:hypothetical protein